MDGTQAFPAAEPGPEPVGVESLPRHYPFLRRLARQTLTSPVEAIDPDDVVQDVMVKVVRRWPLLRFADERALAGYLQRAVINRARDAQRLASRRVEGLELDTFHSPGPSPLDRVVAGEWRRRCAAALLQMRAGDRRVVLGRVVSSLSFGAVAARTGHPSADAARKATSRALARLRRQLSRAS